MKRTFSMTEAVYLKLRKFAFNARLPMSEVVKRALEHYIGGRNAKYSLRDRGEEGPRHGKKLA